MTVFELSEPRTILRMARGFFLPVVDAIVYTGRHGHSGAVTRWEVW